MELAKPHIPLHADLALESGVLRILWHRGLTTLQSLQTPLGVTASGQNDHFHAVFGRDSLWTVLLALEAGRLQQIKEKGNEAESQTLISLEEASHGGTSLEARIPAFQYREWLHELAATVLRGLASLQGKVVNDVNEEQPGRIVHEFWDPIPKRMVMARWPVAYGKGRYYGAFDATFLYLITVAQVDKFFSDAALLEELWPSVELALHWMLNWSDLDQDGLVEYSKRNPEGIGLANQVWKDSAESVQTLEHEPLKHPLAWIEVQGYAWAAYAAYLELARKRNCLDGLVEQEILCRMDGLQKGLLRFWLPEEGFSAIVLDGEKHPIPAVSSNPGHLLWSGCLEQVQAEQICRRLMQPDLLTPWGLRTLSQHAHYYNPLMYHCGAIWPFDNAVIAIGLQRYGFAEEAKCISKAVLEAMFAFDEPVELYTVQPARWLRSHRIEQDWFLADYFSACKVQAWTAGAILYFTSMFL